MADIVVDCVTETGGHRCLVSVSDDRGTTDHVVTIRGAAIGGDPERLVHETFRFLLEREPKESILRTFDIDVVERYFPDYPAEITRRLGA